MCKWTKEDFEDYATRDYIPHYDFRKCGEDFTTRDMVVRNNPAWKEKPKQTEVSQPLPLTQPAAVQIPKEVIGLGMLALGLLLIGSQIWPQFKNRKLHKGNP